MKFSKRRQFFLFKQASLIWNFFEKIINPELQLNFTCSFESFVAVLKIRTKIKLNIINKFIFIRKQEFYFIISE